MKTNPRVLDALEAAYAPCPAFSAACASRTWNPTVGHVPRGFTGAFGEVDQVQLVLVAAEPGDPQDDESYPKDATPRQLLEAAMAYTYRSFAAGRDLFHRNMRKIIDMCWPDESFDEQLRHVWITDSVLCSADDEGGGVLRVVERECRSRYLEAQLRLFDGAPIVALGDKVANRLKGWPNVTKVYSVSPPGVSRYKAQALESWKLIPPLVRR